MFPVRKMLAALCVNVLTANMFLSVFCPPGVLAETCKSDVSLTTPQKMEALSGTCLLIPCSFKPDQFDSNREVSAVWIKGEVGLKNIYDISNAVKTFTVNITGNLTERDCTSEFSGLKSDHSGDYFFRIQNLSFKTTARCDPLHLTVKGSPQSPTIEIAGGLKDLKEKESVSITCSAWTPCPHSPPELTWNLQQDSQKTEKNPDGTFTTKIQETITLSDTHDGSNISCSVRYPVDGGKRNETAGTNLPLSVSYAPKDTSASISPSGLVSAGSWVELSCSSRAKPPVRTFTWFWICKDGPVNVSEGQVYGFNFTEGGEFYCVATNDLGNQTSSVIFLSIKDNHRSGVSLYVTLKILGIVTLCSSVIIFECWFRSRSSNKPKEDSEEPDYVNRVIEVQAS